MNAPVQERLVVIGGSAAGARAAQTALTLGGHRRIDVISADPAAPFYRPGLSKQLLQGTWTPDRAAQPAPDSDSLTWHSGVCAIGVDRDRQRVELDNDSSLPFDRLVIASGCRPRRLDTTGSPAPARRLFQVSRIQDVLDIRGTLPPGGHALVMGAGLIGSEVASSLAAAGVRVTMIDPSTAPLARALGPVGDRVCGTWHHASSVTVRLGCAVDAVLERDDGIDVRLSDGETLATDIAISCLGVVPDTDWLGDSGIPLRPDGGVACDENLLVEGYENVAAAGDVASWESARTGRPTRVEHWLTAVEQGAAAAKNVCAEASEREPFDAVPMFWTEQHGHLVHFVGHHDAHASWDLVEGTEEDEQLVAVASSHGVPTGYLLVDAARRLGHYRRELTLTKTDCAVT